MFKRFKFVVIAFILISLFLLGGQAYASVNTDRISGIDRFNTAVAISREGWPDGSQYAVLTTGEDFPDALSAAPLAKKYNAPILLTGRDYLNSDTAAELRRLKVRQVYIVGGVGVISSRIESSLKSMMSGLTVTRIAGADRYETSANVAQIVGISNGFIAASGDDFSDALSAAPVAANKGMPVILVSKNEVSPSITKFLTGKKITNSYLIDCGMGDTVKSYFKDAKIITGENKYERNVNLINTFSEGLDLSKVYVATGLDFPDALGASVLAARTSSPIIMTEGSVPKAIRDFLMSNVISDICVVGGSGVVSYTAESLIKGMPAYILSTDTIYLSVLANEKYDLPKTVSSRVYSQSEGVKTVELPVTWKLTSMDTSSSFYSGSVKGYSGSAQLVVNSKAVPDSVDPLTANVIQYGQYNLPDEVQVRLSDGTYRDMPVIWSTSSISLNKIGTIQVKGTVEGYGKDVTLKINILEEKEVSIPDAVFKSIIYYNLNKPNQGQAIYLSDLLSLTSLKYSNAGTIANLTGIEFMTNLKRLEITNTTLGSLNGLQNLTNLKTLILKNDGIADISPIKSLTGLEYLDLSSNKITSISSLKGLTRLKYLYLANNYNNSTNLTDYSPVRAYYSSLIDRDFTYTGK